MYRGGVWRGERGEKRDVEDDEVVEEAIEERGNSRHKVPL